MKKNAFTLIELIAIITILAVIIVFSVPSLVSTIKKNDEKRYNDFLDNIYMAAENYIVLKEEDYPEIGYVKGKAVIQIKDLVENRYITSTMTNPKTKREVQNTDTVIITRNLDRTYGYQFYEGDYTSDSYSQNGLLFYFDGYQMPSGNSWNDMTNKFPGKLVNFDETSGWKGNHILLDGINDYIDIPDITLNYEGSITVSAVYRIKSSKANSATGILGTETIGNGRLFFGFGSNYGSLVPTSNSFVMNFAEPDTWLATTDTNKGYQIDQIYNVTITYKGNGTGKNAIYVNNQKLIENNIANSGWSVNGLKIGKAFGLNSYLTQHPYANIELYNIMLYNRELSNDEIAKNYEISQARYGVGE